MATVYKAKYVALHVRRTNRAAISLYRDSLGFQVHNVEKSYCAPIRFEDTPAYVADCRSLGLVDADGEDAYGVRTSSVPSQAHLSDLADEYPVLLLLRCVWICRKTRSVWHRLSFCHLLTWKASRHRARPSLFSPRIAEAGAVSLRLALSTRRANNDELLDKQAGSLHPDKPHGSGAESVELAAMSPLALVAERREETSAPGRNRKRAPSLESPVTRSFSQFLRSSRPGPLRSRSDKREDPGHVAPQGGRERRHRRRHMLFPNP